MTPQQIDAMKLALEALKNNKPTHLYCEDIWYSCPKHEDGCANEAEGDECNCGADEINAEFDKAITAINESLKEHAMRETQRLGQEIEQEPVAIKRMKEWIEYLKRKSDFGQHMKIPSEMSAGACWELAIELEQFINTTPPQRKPLTEEQRKDLINKVWNKWLSGKTDNHLFAWHFSFEVEAAHGIKETT